MDRPHFTLALMKPKYWMSWFGIGIWWLIVQCLPFRVQMALGGRLGHLMVKLSKRRRITAEKNLEMCFPELTESERLDIYNQCVESAGKGLFETGMAWFWPRWRLSKRYQIEGLEHLHAAKDAGQGVLFMGIHFTPIEICAAFMNISYSIDGFYRPHSNAVYDYVQRKGRERHNNQSRVIPRSDVRGMIRSLRKGKVINYAPDQDYGADHSIFVPFFGIPAATITAPSQLVRTGKAQIIPYTTERLDKEGKYIIRVYPHFDGFADGEVEADATRINEFVEARVRENPGQYLWVHRRFKTRPDGQRDFYGIGRERWRDG